MKKLIKNYGQLALIVILSAVLIYSNKGNKIEENVLVSSVYVDIKINESNEVIRSVNADLYNTIQKIDSTNENKQTINEIHFLVDSICSQIVHLKRLAIDISGGIETEDNYYTIKNFGYNFGHSNKLTGDKGKHNGEGSKLKKNIEKLRQLEISVLKDSRLDKIVIEQLLNTSEKQEENSDYVFSWEEQYFKLLPTVGVLNLLSVIETNVLNSELLVLQELLKKQ